MKITTTKDGTVSFLQMTPEIAAMLIDIAHDLAEGNAVLLYDPRQYELFTCPSETGAETLKKVGAAYDRPTTAIGCNPWEDGLWVSHAEIDGEVADRLWREARGGGESE